MEIKKRFLKEVIQKSQTDNEPREFMIAIGLVTIVFLLVCAGVAGSFFRMISEIVRIVSAVG